jgi:NAD-dependent dihydropyrimidine dehydrogenase PreA subunit
MGDDVYGRLADHLATLGMGYPPGEELENILKENFTPEEATVALGLPTKVPPLRLVPVDDIVRSTGLPRSGLVQILESLTSRGLLFSGQTRDGEKGYALQQMGYGFPQAFFWKGENTPHSQKMARLVRRYAKKRDVNFQAYGTTETKNYRYIPVNHGTGLDVHAVLPFDQMETIIGRAERIAVAHCPCRVTAQLLGRQACDHAMEVCMKYDELASYVIERGMAREISKGEALEIIVQCEEAGLVHMVDNAREEIKHTCNCCGCCCWSVGTIKRRRIARDDLVATYFIRDTDREACVGCGQCVEVCPVDAISMKGDYPAVEREWCIGCGVCMRPCPTSAVRLDRRSPKIPPKDFVQLHDRILRDRGLE